VSWLERKRVLRETMLAAMGPFPATPCALETRILGVLRRPGYRLEKLVFQTRPDVWATATLYVPDPVVGKRPAVLAVHGHWPWARRDPVVQARCLGLVKLGFVVLALDAFGAGERYPWPGRGTYHGALFGASLWPVGQTLLGMQVYDNLRAVDYLRSRPEVDANHLGITGASGGGNQTMYAGALDERFRAVVPVCSVGTYQAYLQSACCVCEVLPGALRFAEEGDILGMIAPRALLVISARRDALQFSPGEAAKSIAHARNIYRPYENLGTLCHLIFESDHDYSRPMREAMYGWMTRWLKEEGDGKPIAEPQFELDQPEQLSCYPDGIRSKAFLFPPSFAAQEARRLLRKFEDHPPDHADEWESTAEHIRTELQRKVFGDFPAMPKTVPAQARQLSGPAGQGLLFSASLYPESGLPVPVFFQQKRSFQRRRPVAVLIHLEGKAEALKTPLAEILANRGWWLVAPDLRATGETRPGNDAIADAPDHNSAEHAVWIGRPLLGQWVVDIRCLAQWLAEQPGKRQFTLVGFGPAGLIGICAAPFLGDQVTAVAAIGNPVSLFSERGYAGTMRMGLLAPGILRLADVPQLAALGAPRRLIIAGGTSPEGDALSENEMCRAFDYTRRIYSLYKAENQLSIRRSCRAEELAGALEDIHG
jgi:dienelactone hydrolase